VPENRHRVLGPVLLGGPAKHRVAKDMGGKLDPLSFLKLGTCLVSQGLQEVIDVLAEKPAWSGISKLLLEPTDC
jgi:hypothetical protein